MITFSECNYTDLFKEHSFCAGAVFADFIHALVFPHYFGFLLQGCHNMTKYYCCKLSKCLTAVCLDLLFRLPHHSSWYPQ